MTGRRLYDLFCDELCKQSSYYRKNNVVVTEATPPAWPFLTHTERSMFSGIAARLKGVRR